MIEASAHRAVAVILAHQGGWDEFLLIAGPILVIVALLVLAKRRVDAAARSDTDGETGSRDGSPTGAGPDRTR